MEIVSGSVGPWVSGSASFAEPCLNVSSLVVWLLHGVKSIHCYRAMRVIATLIFLAYASSDTSESKIASPKGGGKGGAGLLTERKTQVSAGGSSTGRFCVCLFLFGYRVRRRQLCI